MIQNALDLAQQGYNVFPIKPRGKTPLTEHGCLDASNDPELITRWWTKWPAANVGIATGSATRLLVVDLDGPEGIDAWITLEQENGSTTTLTAATGSGGFHLYFHASDTKNTARKVGAGIDTRGDGGYVVAPPSIHPNGTAYAWKNTKPIADAPSWLLALLARREQPTTTTREHAIPTTDLGDAYANKAWPEILTRVRTAGEGTRNDQLNASSYSAGRLVASGLLTRHDAEADLLLAAQACGLSEHEARTTITSGLNAGQQVPVELKRDTPPHRHLTPVPTTPPPAAENNGDAPPEEKIQARVYARSALSYAIERVHWLEEHEGFIPMRMVTLCAGLPGLGKSMFVCYLAAKESRAGRTVLIAAAEDSIEHVLIPRLIAARADLHRVHFVGYEDEHGDGALHLPDHGNLLRSAVKAMQPSILMVDPIGSFLGRAVDAWKDTDVRAALGPFKTIAEENNCACLLVAHLNKGSGPYLKRISNSAAFGQFVRSGLLFGRDPDDKDREKGVQRVLVSGKLNVGAIPQARCYSIESKYIPSHDGTPPNIATARLAYTGESPHSTEELLANSERTTTEPSPETKEAMLLLSQMLANDASVPRKDIEKEARSWGLSMTPVYKAAERMDVVFEMAGFQKGTNWSLPK